MNKSKLDKWTNEVNLSIIYCADKCEYKNRYGITTPIGEKFVVHNSQLDYLCRKGKVYLEETYQPPYYTYGIIMNMLFKFIDFEITADNALYLCEVVYWKD